MITRTDALHDALDRLAGYDYLDALVPDAVYLHAAEHVLTHTPPW